ncbi:MAG: copper homeostasis protein CutC [Fusicatenibacter sp.]|nr:copper homeostasis protein CutC [Fusicatenibacter sp.]
MKDYILEICADSVESALAAEAGGATRLELCGNLVIGGTTPSPKLYEEIRKYSKIPMHILIRPRFGDFCYTQYEYEIIRAEVEMFRDLGAEGVVIGVLSEDGTLNRTAMEGLMEAAKGMSVTLHRAFDVCADPLKTMEEAISLGMNTILTSGQENTCEKGVRLLSALEKQADGRIRIQAGGGVNAEVIQKLYPLCGISAWHMSGKSNLDSAMKYRKEGVNMGLPSLSEYTIFRTSQERVCRAKEVLEQL